MYKYDSNWNSIETGGDGGDVEMSAYATAIRQPT